MVRQQDAPLAERVRSRPLNVRPLSRRGSLRRSRPMTGRGPAEGSPVANPEIPTMSKKLMAMLAVVVLGAGFVYKTVLAAPTEAGAEPKLQGVVYVLSKEFLVNLSDGRYAKFSVAVVLPETPEAHGEETPPEGYGPLAEEAVIRTVVVDVVGASTGEALTTVKGRRAVRHRVLRRVERETDAEVKDVLFPDITVQ